MKTRDLIELLEGNGWHQVRMKGSHRQYQYSVIRGTITVAGKSGLEIPPGTLHRILKQAGLKKRR